VVRRAAGPPARVLVIGWRRARWGGLVRGFFFLTSHRGLFKTPSKCDTGARPPVPSRGWRCLRKRTDLAARLFHCVGEPRWA